MPTAAVLAHPLRGAARATASVDARPGTRTAKSVFQLVGNGQVGAGIGPGHASARSAARCRNGDLAVRSARAAYACRDLSALRSDSRRRSRARSATSTSATPSARRSCCGGIAKRSRHCAAATDPTYRLEGDMWAPILRPRADYCFALSASISAGTTLCTSPTMPRSATEKIGASPSLLTAMMLSLLFMPTRCWVAPEMPSAM